MNKKRLSVVMAGAMLASSVAPVLAAETVVNESERGLLIKRLRELLESKKFSNIQANIDALKDKNGKNTEDGVGESVYYIKINGSDIYRLSQIADLEKALQDAPAGTKVEVVDRGHIEKDGVVYNHALEDIKTTPTYTEANLEDIYNDFKGAKRYNYSDVVLDMTFEKGVLSVITRKADGEDKHVVVTLKDGDKKIWLNKPHTSNHLEAVAGLKGEWANFDHFEQQAETTVEKDSNLPEKVIETIILTDVDNTYETVLSNLYDGLFLTTNGQKLLDTLKEYDEKGYTIEGLEDKGVNKVVDTGRGIYEVKITLSKTVGKETIKQAVVIKSNNKEQLTLFANGISLRFETPGHGTKIRKFPVQKLVGSDRVETAVKVAKENADIKTVALNGNIVLVNKESLVDGLAAAPLAASVVNDTVVDRYPNFVAPILLTNTNGLPKATKDYMKELVAHQQVGALDKVTVYLVGGESVISKAVENDLKEIGLRVVRAGGEDREETSLKVAKLIEKETDKEFDSAFVVGADGEADAMSVAPVAANSYLDSTGGKVTPIIVESRKGISDNTIEYLRGYKNPAFASKNVTIIGGETVVSKATEETLKAEKISVDRIAGENRQLTNAKVIKAFYENNSINHVLVSKDGKGNNGQLIDALTATSLAAKYNSPIVLGTNSLTKEQINAIELKASRDINIPMFVYQIGGNVADSVVRTIAQRLNLSK